MKLAKIKWSVMLGQGICTAFYEMIYFLVFSDVKNWYVLEMLNKIRLKIAQNLAEKSDFSVDETLKLFEVPKKQNQGHLSLPVFQWAKTLKKAPHQIASSLADEVRDQNLDELEAVESVAGFVNFTLKTSYLQSVLEEEIASPSDKQKIGWSQSNQGKTLAIDYSSPNVAKPMNIGHLRATVIGRAVYNLAKTQGYKVIGINHLGDWGVQFGKLAWAYQNWGAEYPFEEQPFDSLFKLYVRFHQEAEENEELNRLGSLEFKKLEDGDSTVTEIWKNFLEISLKEYDKLWKRLGVSFDLIQGESFYNDYLQDVEDRLSGKNLLVESEGAKVVELGEDVPPCLIRKSDGSSLYATRDLAGAIYRKEKLQADLNLYVVGMEQSLHFKQVFQVLEKLGYDWSSDCHHIAFGMYRFKEGKMSTRKGNVIFLKDILDKSVALVKEVIQEKNPELENKDKIAEQVGVGAIVFNDLINDRVRNVDFEWSKILDFEGSSGPYVQYCQVRCNSLIKKYGKEIPLSFVSEMTEEAENNLMFTLSLYPDVLSKAFNQFKPHYLAQYLVDLGRAFNHFYQKCRVLGGEESVEQSRMLLVSMTRDVLRSGLAVLNIESPEAM